MIVLMQVIDLIDAEDGIGLEERDIALDLIARSDVVVENFSPRVMANFDLEWEAVHAVNPRAIMVRMPAFGLDGPWRDRVGFAQTMDRVNLSEYVRVNNIANVNYVGSVIVGDTNGRYYEPAPGRNWYAGVSISVAF